MKRILIIGCSWSRQFNDPGDAKISWCEIMHQRLQERGLAIETYNTSVVCSSIFDQWYKLKFYLHYKTWDLIILQFTGFQRKTYIRDEWEYTETLKKLEPGGIHNLKDYYEPSSGEMVPDWITYGFNKHGYLHLNPGTAQASEYTSEYKNAYLTDCMFSLGDHDPQCRELQILIEKQMIQDAKQDNIPVIAYRHWKQHLNKDYNNHLDFCVSTDLENWKDYMVDGGHHFGRRGNTQIVEKLIMPRVLECIDTKI